jgi:hypothetical protein
MWLVASPHPHNFVASMVPCRKLEWSRIVSLYNKAHHGQVGHDKLSKSSCNIICCGQCGQKVILINCELYLVLLFSCFSDSISHHSYMCTCDFIHCRTYSMLDYAIRCSQVPGTPHKKCLFYRSFTWFLYQSNIFAECPDRAVGWVLSDRHRKCTANCIQLISLCKGNLCACSFLIPIESSWRRHGQHCMSDCFALCHVMQCLVLLNIVLLKRRLIGIVSCTLNCLSCAWVDRVMEWSLVALLHCCE